MIKKTLLVIPLLMLSSCFGDSKPQQVIYNVNYSFDYKTRTYICEQYDTEHYKVTNTWKVKPEHFYTISVYAYNGYKLIDETKPNYDENIVSDELLVYSSYNELFVYNYKR